MAGDSVPGCFFKKEIVIKILGDFFYSLAFIAIAAIGIVGPSFAFMGCTQETKLVESPPAVCVEAFTAPWCESCQKIKPKLKLLQDAGVDVQIINIEKRPDLVKRRNIKSVPTFLIFSKGSNVMRTGSIDVVLWRCGQYLKDAGGD